MELFRAFHQHHRARMTIPYLNVIRLVSFAGGSWPCPAELTAAALMRRGSEQSGYRTNKLNQRASQRPSPAHGSTGPYASRSRRQVGLVGRRGGSARSVRALFPLSPFMTTESALLCSFGGHQTPDRSRNRSRSWVGAAWALIGSRQGRNQHACCTVPHPVLRLCACGRAVAVCAPMLIGVLPRWEGEE